MRAIGLHAQATSPGVSQMLTPIKTSCDGEGN